MDYVIAGFAGLSMITWASGIGYALLSPVRRATWVKRTDPVAKTTIRMRKMETKL